MKSQNEGAAPSPTPDSDTAKPRRPRGCGGIFLFFMVFIGALWGMSLGGFVALLDRTQTTIEGLDEWRPKVGSKVYSDDGEVLAEFTTSNRQLVPLSEIPLNLQKAFLAREDQTFYEHKGVRPDAILSAMWYIARTGKVRGASTITMQLVRNVDVPGFPDKTQTMKRKVLEALVALQVEREFTKDEILELYLNQIFLGVSANGVEAASQQYFGKSCRDLTLSECALLAGITKSPNSFEPFSNPEGARQQRDTVLDSMLEYGFITQADHDTAVAVPMDKLVLSKEERKAQAKKTGRHWVPGTTLAPYFVEEVRQQILNKRSKDEVFEGGLAIYTTLDMRLQRAAEDALLTALDEFDAKKLESLKKQGHESEFVPVTGALICLDNRPGMEGYVRAMVGGRDFTKQKFNNVTQAKRQPGSSIKPFVWATAIDNGMTASDIIVDEPFEQVVGTSVYRPQNFDGKFSGPVTLRTALERSINIVSIKLVRKFTLPLVRSYVQRCGITSDIGDDVGLTIALGSPVVTPLDHCIAYSTFAKGGTLVRQSMVREIRERDGFVVYTNQIQKKPDVLKPELAYVMTYLMQGVATYGTGAYSAKLGRPRAGKTGTSNDAKDVWFCGFTPDYTCVVWIGYKDNRSLGRGADYTGGRMACPVWTAFMTQAEEGLPVRDFVAPEKVKFYNVDKSSGVAGGKFSEAFIAGTAPPEVQHIPEYEERESLEMLDESPDQMNPQ
ncbi:MAG: PBP1A family penicillin-binding protein [Candidatus Hydrogenedentes bacterium]|nr:PBP1A family penicillin-binding protein [Candidatus Hydrogenedentota bacterium]